MLGIYMIAQILLLPDASDTNLAHRIVQPPRFQGLLRFSQSA